MGIKGKLAKIWALRDVISYKAISKNPVKSQTKVLNYLIKNGRKTVFGFEHDFNNIDNYNDFKKRVPIRDYESLKPYINKAVDGNTDVLWPGKPIYLSKTSGTTSGVKYIPISKESMKTHINSARSALLHYIHYSGNSNFINGKVMFLQGSPTLKKVNNIKTGRLSGIVAHYVPKYLQKNRLPTWSVNCIEDWNKKVDAIVEQTINEDMRLIGGIPPWVKMYFEKLKKKSNKKIGEIFPNFSLFVYGGVNFEPYRKGLENLVGKKIDSIELYPASEGFIAFQDSTREKGMLLNLKAGIFYEFVEPKHINNPKKRMSLKDVRTGVNYAIILNTSAGLWGYKIGDTIEFTSLKPFRIIVTGRLKHFISAFGEHVIVKEVEYAMKKAIKATGEAVNEFTVAPNVNPSAGKSHHEWWISFQNKPKNIMRFSKNLDKLVREQNIYYDDLVKGGVLSPLSVIPLKKDAFEIYMKRKGKLGGQNKTPRLMNNRSIVAELKEFKIKL